MQNGDGTPDLMCVIQDRLGGPTSFSFYAIVVISLNKNFQFNSIQLDTHACSTLQVRKGKDFIHSL